MTARSRARRAARTTCAGTRARQQPPHAVGPTRTPSTLTRSSSGTLLSPCSPRTQASTLPGRDAHRPGEAGPQPQAVVQRVAEDEPPVEAGPLLQPGHERIDGIRDDDHHALPGRRQLVGQLVGDHRVPVEVLEPRRTDRERCRRQEHDDVRIPHVAHVAARDGAARRQLERLLEVHDVGRDHLRARVDEDDLVAVARQGEVEGRRRPYPSGAAHERDPHAGHRPALPLKNQMICV